MRSPSADDVSRIGPFALEEALGGNPRSRVLRAVHVQQGLPAAVKLLPRDLIAQPLVRSGFLEDAKRLAQLRHPGIARVYGGAVDRGQPYLAAELVEGETLRQRLDRQGRVAWETAVGWAEQIGEALAHAHAHGVVHRRLTPGRVLLTPDDRVKLVGFDCAWLDRDDVLGLRAPMEVAHYLAPESFRGKASASAPGCDLFSLGVLLYEALTGELPWPAAAPQALILARRAAPAPRASTRALDCPVWLDALVARLLECKRRHRLTTIDEFRHALAHARRKVAAGTGAAQQAWSGQQGALAIDRDRREIRALRAAHRSRPTAPAAPFYERAWFLAGCLALVVGCGLWLLRPAAEQQLIARARPLMASDKPTDWRRAQDQYLEELLARFPETAFRDEIAVFQEKYAVHRARERLKNLDRFGRLPETEAERRCAQAWRAERDGDRLEAWQLYSALAVLLAHETDLEQRAFGQLAQEGMERVRTAAAADADRNEFVAAQLRLADEARAGGQPEQAQAILTSLVTLYDEVPDVANAISVARASLRALAGEMRTAPSE